VNKTNSLDNFFILVSRAVIIIPIFIFIFALIFKFNQSKPSNIYSIISPTVFISPTLSIINKIPIDLIGPWVCQYQEGQKQYNLSIKNKNIILQVKENNQTKKYDLSSYVPYAESFLNADISVLENLINQYSGKKINLKEVLKSCKKEV
jgi:hypothetical protein